MNTTESFHAAKAAVLSLFDRAREYVRPKRSATLDAEAVNGSFHRAYAAARGRNEDDAILVVFSDRLVLCRGTEERSFPLAHAAYELVKSAAHAPVGVYSTLADETAGTLRVETKHALLELEASLCTFADRIESDDADSVPDIRAVLLRTCAFLSAMLARNERLPGALAAFARESEPALLRLTAHAARLQLSALHDRVEDVMHELTADERMRLEVVVTGEHQARDRSLPMQYFARRAGRDAPDETLARRLCYAEGVSDVAGARALVATRRLDRVLARAFFGDETRLQADVLGRAAEEALAHWTFRTKRRRPPATIRLDGDTTRRGGGHRQMAMARK